MTHKSPKQLRLEKQEERARMGIMIINTDPMVSKIQRSPPPRYYSKKTHVARRRRRKNHDAEWEEFDQWMYEYQLREDVKESIKVAELSTATLTKTGPNQWKLYGDNIN